LPHHLVFVGFSDSDSKAGKQLELQFAIMANIEFIQCILTLFGYSYKNSMCINELQIETLTEWLIDLLKSPEHSPKYSYTSYILLFTKSSFSPTLIPDLSDPYVCTIKPLSSCFWRFFLLNLLILLQSFNKVHLQISNGWRTAYRGIANLPVSCSIHQRLMLYTLWQDFRSEHPPPLFWQVRFVRKTSNVYWKELWFQSSEYF